MQGLVRGCFFWLLCVGSAMANQAKQVFGYIEPVNLPPGLPQDLNSNWLLAVLQDLILDLNLDLILNLTIDLNSDLILDLPPDLIIHHANSILNYPGLDPGLDTGFEDRFDPRLSLVIDVGLDYCSSFQFHLNTDLTPDSIHNVLPYLGPGLIEKSPLDLILDLISDLIPNLIIDLIIDVLLDLITAHLFNPILNYPRPGHRFGA